MRRAGLVVWAVALVVGLAAERVAFDWDEPLRWLPDLVVGLVLVGAAVDAWPRSRAVAWLVGAAGFAWFAGTVAPVALYWHRGFLVHLLVAYPVLRPQSCLGLAAMVAGYLAAVFPMVWRDDVASIVLSAVLTAVVVRTYLRATGRHRHDGRVALYATLAFAAATAGGAVARLLVPAGDAAIPTLVVYEAVLCAVAVGLAAGLRVPAVGRVTDLVVELGTGRSGTLRDALARTLGDPTLEVGYWQPDLGAYVDAAGRRVGVPEQEQPRTATRVDHDGRPFAVLVHDAAVLGDPALADAVAAATRLTAANADLQAEVRDRVAEVAASRRRLLLAADEERQRLGLRLQDGVVSRLQRLSGPLATALRQTQAEPAERVALARSRLEHTLEQLHELARGLHPRELDDGLAAALSALAARSTIPVRLSVSNERYPAELEVAAYYTCAEALTNVTKHASASSVLVEVGQHDGVLRVVVADDGVGGADPSHGTGLRGLGDRVEALGGRLNVASAPGDGTRVTAEFPVDCDPGS